MVEKVNWENIDNSQYKICRNTLNKNRRSQLSLNAAVSHKNTQVRPPRTLGKALQTTIIKLD
ncbi:MAG: hypothetical protein K0M45_07730 [Candidatus Paracaedibacteraceae bacterium]|nr:hypothetical protein [Candidatus Paracaedibacteraceae bacterium]